MTMTWLPVHRCAQVGPQDALTFADARSFTDQTVRQVLNLYAAGPVLRLHLSNRFGTETLAVGEIRAAIHLGDGAVDLATDRAVTVDGITQVKIAPGETRVTDPVELPLPPGAGGVQLTVSIYHEVPSGLATNYPTPLQPGYATRGNTTAAATLESAELLAQLFWITGVDMQTTDDTAEATRAPIVAAFGDSLTSGDGSTAGTNRRYPDNLARRLGHPVLNLGISGNRLLRDGYGQAGLTRFQRDVLEIPGVSHVIIELGINDLGQAGPQRQPQPSAADLIGGLTTLARRARDAGVVPIVATLPPFRDTIYPGAFTELGEQTRQAVNDWIRTAAEAESVVDIAAALDDPDHPGRLHPDLDSGDRLHPNDLGYQAIADAVDLSILVR
ncbi:MAG TPA: SGNH/GDSL hydrolase family protein [Actinocrinis sp.]|nr:SGNH/GDSL hydrolase family protein [Actinocrinis sp.]